MELNIFKIKDTGEIQVEAVLLVPPLVAAHYLLDDGSHVGASRLR